LKTEQQIQSEIRIALSKYGFVFRTNASDFWQGKQIFSPELKPVLIALRRVQRLPAGFSDLLFAGFDGKIAFIECKNTIGHVRPEQEIFIANMHKYGYRAGIVRSVDDALELIR